MVYYMPESYKLKWLFIVALWNRADHYIFALWFLMSLPCSASTVRDRKISSITLNKNSTRAFQRAINQGSMLPLTSSK